MNDTDFDEILNEAERRTDKFFEEEIAKRTRLTQEEINEIAPTTVDKNKLGELLKVVEDATKSNEQKAQALRNIAGLAELAVSVLKKVVFI